MFAIPTAAFSTFITWLAAHDDAKAVEVRMSATRVKFSATFIAYFIEWEIPHTACTLWRAPSAAYLDRAEWLPLGITRMALRGTGGDSTLEITIPHERCADRFAFRCLCGTRETLRVEINSYDLRVDRVDIDGALEVTADTPPEAGNPYCVLGGAEFRVGELLADVVRARTLVFDGVRFELLDDSVARLSGATSANGSLVRDLVVEYLFAARSEDFYGTGAAALDTATHDDDDDNDDDEDALVTLDVTAAKPPKKRTNRSEPSMKPLERMVLKTPRTRGLVVPSTPIELGTKFLEKLLACRQFATTVRFELIGLREETTNQVMRLTYQCPRLRGARLVALLMPKIQNNE